MTLVLTLVITLAGQSYGLESWTNPTENELAACAILADASADAFCLIESK